MAAGRGAIAKPLDPSIRVYLFHGPDESRSRALAQQVAAALGEDAERIDLEPARLKADAALLADEAAAVSMFGGARWIRVEGVGDESLAAIEALLEASAAGNPVVLMAGTLRRDGKLLKRLEGDRSAKTIFSAAPQAADLARAAVDLGRAQGLRIGEDIARRLAEASGNDGAILANEVEKLVLYADATPDRPCEADHTMLDAIGADAGEADVSRLVEAVIGGDAAAVDAELERKAGGGEGIRLIRAVQRRLFSMAPDASRWPPARIAAAIDRLSHAERALKMSRGAGPIAADAELLTIARSTRRR